MAEPYATEEEMKGRAGEGFYVRDLERDKDHCPGGGVLRHKSVRKNGDTSYANKTACQNRDIPDGVADVRVPCKVIGKFEDYKKKIVS